MSNYKIKRVLAILQMYQKNIYPKIKKIVKKYCLIIYSSFNVIRWKLSQKRRYCKIFLEDYNLSNIKPINKRSWLNNKKYFVAECEGMKVFIKFGGVINLIKREVEIFDLLKSTQIKKSIPKIIKYEVKDSFFFLAEEYINGKPINETKNLTQEQKDILINKIMNIFEFMNKIQLRHMDLKPDNIMYTNTDGLLNVYIIDFGMSFVGSENILSELSQLINENDKKEYLQNLGGGYNPMPFQWDDTYSLLEILKVLDPFFAYNHKNLWLNLCSRVGNNNVCVKKNKIGHYKLYIKRIRYENK